MRTSLEEQLYLEMREAIVGGQFAAGQRLPTHRDLQKRFDAAPQSVQRAMSRLTRDGFLVPRGRAGTFVADRPPHLFRYGIIFQSAPTGGDLGYWPPTWEALNNAALTVEHIDPRRRVVPYYSITGHEDVESYQVLLRDLHAARLAGLIFVTGVSTPVLSSPLFDDPNLPRIQLYVRAPHHGIPSIGVGDVDFYLRALDYFAAQGRKRIALIDIPGSPWLNTPRLAEEIERRGMTTRPHWQLGVSPQSAESAKRVTELLMSLPPDQRPDGLIAVSSIYIEHVTAGLVEADVRVPRELDLISGTVFPLARRAHTPVKWLGVDVRDGLRLAIEMIDRQRGGIQPPLFTEVADSFEEELPQTNPLLGLIEGQKPSAAATTTNISEIQLQGRAL